MLHYVQHESTRKEWPLLAADMGEPERDQPVSVREARHAPACSRLWCSPRLYVCQHICPLVRMAERREAIHRESGYQGKLQWVFVQRVTGGFTSLIINSLIQKQP